MGSEAKKVGFALTGSFCTFSQVVRAIEQLAGHGWDVTPIMSTASHTTDTRFGSAADFVRKIEAICAKPMIASIAAAEPIGPKKLFDILVVAPATGNTLAKIAAGIADTPVTLAVKSHLRNNRPVVLAVSTNDGLGANAASIGKLLARKHLYFVPFGQDDPVEKPNSLVADFGKIEETVAAALENRQLQPLLLRGTMPKH